MTSVIRTISAAAAVGRFCWRHKRLTLALAVGLLIVAPLLTGGGGTFFLNLLGLGIAGLVIWRIVQAGKGRQANCRCNCNRRNTNNQQQGGTP